MPYIPLINRFPPRGSMVSKKIVMAIVVILAIALVAGYWFLAKPKERVVRIGAIKALGVGQIYVAIAKGWLEQEGIKYTYSEFSSGPALMEAFAAGEIDVAFAGLVPATVWRDKGVPLKIVALTCAGGHALITMPNSGIKSVKDLKGKKVAEPRRGSVTDILTRAFIIMEKGGMDPEKDLELYEMKPADMPYALQRGDIDAAVTWEPFVSQAVLQMGAVIVFDVIKEWPGYPVNSMFVREDFLKENKDLVLKLISIHQRATDFINNHPDEANKILAEHLGLSVEIIEKARERVIFRTKIPVSDAIKLISFAHKLGYISRVPSPEEIFWTESPAYGG